MRAIAGLWCTMQFGVLGMLEVRSDDGTPITVSAPMRRVLLATMLMHGGRPVSTGELMAVLWGDEPPEAATASLHAQVSRLRREIGHDRIVTSPAGYAIRVGDGELDARSFEQLAGLGRIARAEERWAAAGELLRSALGLWSGRAFADMQDQPVFANEAARLDALRLTALEDRIDADLAMGRHRDLCVELETLVDLHPLREQLWCQLMLALYRSGRQADGLAAFRRLRTTLSEDLGIDPSPEAQQLEIRILQQDPSLDLPRTPRPRPTGIGLPAPLSSTVGRRRELGQAIRLLGTHRLVTFTGSGGVGKTRLAVLVARATERDHPDGTLFVDLSTVHDPGQVLARIGETTGGGGRAADVIGSREILLILDNAEHVLDSAPAVAGLLAECPSLTLLVTSRAPLRIEGEQRFEVPPLPRSDAVRLFKLRAREALQSVDLPNRSIADIVERLDGLPLAIELAAAQVAFQPVDALQQRLTERLAVLTAGRRDAPDRHQTLHETIAWSYRLLDPSARRAMRAVSVLAGRFDRPAAIAVADCDEHALTALVDQSLVRRVGDRYALLETIREFARSALEAAGEVDVVRDRHLAHFRTMAWQERARTNGQRGSRTSEWLAMCDAERDNLRAAFDWAAQRGDRDSVVTLFRAVGMYWLLIGAMDEGERWGAAARRAAEDAAPETRMRVLALSSEFPRFGGEPERSISLKLQAIELARSIRDEEAAAVVLDDLSSVYAAVGSYDEARQCIADSLAIHDRRAGDDPLNRAHTLTSLIELELLEGRPEAAAAALRELDEIEAGRNVAPDWHIQSGLLRAHVLRATGRLSEAADQYLAVARDAVGIGFRMAIADALDGLAILAASARPTHAARLFGASDRLRAESGLAAWSPVTRRQVIADVESALGCGEFARVRAHGHAQGLRAVDDVLTRAR